MRESIFDTSLLISHWRRSRGPSIADHSSSDPKKWAARLIALHQTDKIVTPVYLEVAGGVTSRHEMNLTRAFLNSFQIIDQGRVTPEDWSLARQLAERIPAGARPTPRGAIDCLIRAIAKRFRCDVLTLDQGMPR